MWYARNLDWEFTYHEVWGLMELFEKWEKAREGDIISGELHIRYGESDVEQGFELIAKFPHNIANYCTAEGKPIPAIIVSIRNKEDK